MKLITQILTNRRRILSLIQRVFRLFMKPTERQKKIYKKIAPIIGINPKVIRYGDDTGEKSIFIMECPDPIDSNINFYSTIGLSDIEVNNKRYEILFTGYASETEIGNILSSCAFFIMKDGWGIKPGAVFETLVEMYKENLDMKHVLFTSPYLWEDKLEDFEVENDKINFLLGIPISDAELKFKAKEGLEALENLFEEEEINIFDINRKSVL